MLLRNRVRIQRVGDESDVIGTTLLQQRADGRVGDVLLRPFGGNLAIGFAGGALARELEAAGDAAALDFVRSVLRDVFGASVDRAFAKGHVTRWASDPWALGAYSAARPGHSHMRSRLAEPVADRVFFAGEACEPQWATQVAGAARDLQTQLRRVTRS